jgi:sterol desaturase/sphingolipid hydroxylase (fatty acid hydroxylase superfamily)
VIRKVAPWSVFKVSLIFYLCLMLVLIGAGMILYGSLGAIGALDSTTRLIRDLFADPEFEINGQWLFSRGVTIGLLMVVVCSVINVFIAFLYNLISDLVGGIEVTLAERR